MYLTDSSLLELHQHLQGGDTTVDKSVFFKAAIRQFAQPFEDTGGADGPEAKIARMLKHAGDATPARSMPSSTTGPWPSPDVSGQYTPAIVAAQRRAISMLEAVAYSVQGLAGQATSVA